jgi:hypothetical protein
MPGYDQNNSTTRQALGPAPKWTDQWGAIVMDQHSGEYGTATGRMTKAQAVNEATHDCAINGSGNCQLLIAYYNQCAALVWGVGKTTAANAQTEEVAQTQAMTKCAANGLQCKVIYSGCSVSKRAN